MSKPEITFIASKDIDRVKWDQCIAQSTFGIAYAYSWYLDRICPNWDALIGKDYQYVMPLVNNRKYGISYIYQPFFTQQLGVFSSLETDKILADNYLDAIPEQFRLIDMKLNIGNVVKDTLFNFRENITYHLPLNSSIDNIRQGYNTNTKRNIQKALQNKLSVSISTDIAGFMEFTQTNLKEKASEVKNQHYSAFQEIIRFALANNLGEIYIVTNEQNSWLAAVFFLNTNQKCIYLAASSNSEGKEKSAMSLLVDSFIQKNAESNRTLDFEGSNIQGIARFYAGFGAIPQIYLSVHLNRLPWVARILKK